jgi:DNA-binding response OmpR family regulator
MKRVLVIDDDRQTLDLVSRWLATAGFQVQTAATFGEGKLQMKDAIDVLIVDVRLHGFNGLQLATKARTDHPGVRIVVVSGWEDPVLMREAAALGALFLTKPFGEEELLHAVEGEKSGETGRTGAAGTAGDAG